MALNDGADKLAVARDYLMQYPAGSQEFDAALEHLRWVKDNRPDLKEQCRLVVEYILKNKGDQQYVVERLESIA